MARVPSYAKTTSLVARALKLPPEALVAGFVPALAQDLAQLVALRKQVIGTALAWDDRAYLAWRYHLGSSGHGRGECWVFKRGGEVLAMLGSEQILVCHRGQAVQGVSVMDIAVRPELDGVGLGVWMAMHLCETFDCVVALGSNSNSRALVSRVFTRLPDRRSYAHLLDFGPTLRRRWNSRVGAGVGAAIAGWVARRWRAGQRLTRDRSLRIEPVARFDASVAPLIQQAGADAEVCIARDAEFLNWRLFGNPRAAYTVWAARRGAEWAGYIALRVKVACDATRVLVIEDMLVQAGSAGAAALKALVCQAFTLAAAEKCERISVIACQLQNERVLRSLGFVAHRADAETVSVRSRDARLNEAINAGAAWHLTGANTDRDDE